MSTASIPSPPPLPNLDKLSREELIELCIRYHEAVTRTTSLVNQHERRIQILERVMTRNTIW